jgi:hypothetical protein
MFLGCNGQDDKFLLDVRDVMTLLGVSKSRAYMVMRKCNEKLAKKGKMTLKGRVNKQFLLEEFNIERGRSDVTN